MSSSCPSLTHEAKTSLRENDTSKAHAGQASDCGGIVEVTHNVHRLTARPVGPPTTKYAAQAQMISKAAMPLASIHRRRRGLEIGSESGAVFAIDGPSQIRLSCFYVISTKVEIVRTVPRPH